MSSSLVRKLGIALALFTVVVAIVLTQWPFEYRLTSFAMRARWHRIDWSWFPRTDAGDIWFSRDFALNLLMLIPLGIGFAVWRRAGAVRVVVESLVLGILTGTLLELGQLLTRSRYTSFPDLWRNAFGCLVGCLLVITIRWLVRRAPERSTTA